ncbi:MAG: hypothetical protein F4X80_08700 [Chloroflexi bacterium]|nr:hypothetical protein [Chloroflexota bacterium]
MLYDWVALPDHPPLSDASSSEVAYVPVVPPDELWVACVVVLVVDVVDDPLEMTVAAVSSSSSSPLQAAIATVSSTTAAIVVRVRYIPVGRCM